MAKKQVKRRAAGRTRPKRAASVASAKSRPASADAIFERVTRILDEARASVVRSVNSAMVLAYWQIGREMVETLQGGDRRGSYGERTVEELAARLTAKYGRGFSKSNLWYFRQFYVAYPDRQPVVRTAPEKLHEPRGESAKPRPSRRRSETPLADLSAAIEHRETLVGFSASLSWTHYRTLMGVEHPAERAFYEIEAEREGWNVAELERQIHTLLFARLLKSRDRRGVLELARSGQELTTPIDALKDPYVLDFLALPDGGALRESDIEAAIIGQLQGFLLELGKGFAFVARQKRLAFEDEHFYVDLVFYNTILKCYLLIDLKIGKLSHQDIGQIDSYVRMFDDQFTTEGDNPTIGLVLCAEKNEAVARYSVLNESKQIFAAKYVKVLPSEAELRREIERERRLFEARRPKKGAR
jgi:predicted nuclease of restriction endonuclease-like (RecB) superfamily